MGETCHSAHFPLSLLQVSGWETLLLRLEWATPFEGCGQGLSPRAVRRVSDFKIDRWWPGPLSLHTHSITWRSC